MAIDWNQLFGAGVSTLFGAVPLLSGMQGVEEDRAQMRDDLYGEGANRFDFGEGGLMGYLGREAQFVPSTVTSRTGSAGFDPNTGQVNYNLSDPQRAQADMLSQGATDFYNRASMDPAAREQEVYERIRAVQRPEEQRQYDQMNANLFGSGRGGMMSSAYGGTPEQFAFGKAQAEARNQAMLGAMGQAQQEMMNYGNLGQMYQQNQYLPEQMLGQQFGQGMNFDQIRNQALQSRAGMLGQMGIGGLTTDVNWGNVYGQLIGELAKAGGAIGTGLGSANIFGS